MKRVLTLLAPLIASGCLQQEPPLSSREFSRELGTSRLRGTLRDVKAGELELEVNLNVPPLKREWEVDYSCVLNVDRDSADDVVLTTLNRRMYALRPLRGTWEDLLKPSCDLEVQLAIERIEGAAEEF